VKLKINAATVDGILSPIAISSPITNLEIPKNKTWKRIGILACLKEEKSSHNWGGNFHLKIIITIRITEIRLISKNKRLSTKLMIYSAFEFDSIQISQIFTNDAMTKSWYISIIYLKGMLQTNP